MKPLNLFVLTIFIFSTRLLVFSQQDDFYKAYVSGDAEFFYKNYENAQNLYTKAISLKPSFKDTYIKRGDSFYEIKNYDKAISDYKIASLKKINIANYKIALCYAQMSNSKKSCEYLEIYLKTHNKLPAAKIKLNKAFQKINDSNEWLSLWKKEYYSSSENTLNEAIYESSRNNDNGALEIIEKYLNKHKKNTNALELRGDILMKLKDFKNAEKSYVSAHKIKPKNTNYILKAGDACFYDKKYKKAIDFYQQYAIIEKYDAKIKTKLATAQFYLKDYQKASENITNYLKYYKQDLEARYLSAKISFAKEDFFLALNEINICLNKTKSTSIFFELRGDIYTKTQTFQNAFDDYSMSLDLNPKQAEIYYKRGITKLKMHDKEGACLDWQKAEKMGFYKASDYLIKYCNN